MRRAAVVGLLLSLAGIRPARSTLCAAGLQVLLEVFGAELAPEVAARYLQEQASGRYRFRQQYARCGGFGNLFA